VNYVSIGEIGRLVSVYVHYTDGMKRKSFVSEWRGFDIVRKGVLTFADMTMPTVEPRIQQAFRMLPAENGHFERYAYQPFAPSVEVYKA
jgi:hypothetical protein